MVAIHRRNEREIQGRDHRLAPVPHHMPRISRPCHQIVHKREYSGRTVANQGPDKKDTFNQRHLTVGLATRQLWLTRLVTVGPQHPA